MSPDLPKYRELSNHESRLHEGPSPLRVLFICNDAGLAARCVQKLKETHVPIAADIVVTVAKGREQLRTQSYEIVVVEHPGSSLGAQSLQVLRSAAEDTPLIILASGQDSHFMADATAHAPFDYVDREHLAQLPMAVRRALNDRKLRAELAELGSNLRHSQSLHLALLENPAYGICRCDAMGTFVDVNQALVAMLGYNSKEELLNAKRTAVKIGNLHPSMASGGFPKTTPIEPVEVEWLRKDGAIRRVRLSGASAREDNGNFIGYEIIVADVTEQYAREEQLRRQASSDPLTGLANHRRLFEVLHAEVGRTKRSGREFSLLLLDLNKLKEINDRFGHLVGDRALCRLSAVLLDCRRSEDTAARQGGDEFALVLPETGSVAAASVAHRIRELLSKDAEGPSLSVSIGIACFPRDATTTATLLQAADRALYAMKNIKLKTYQLGAG
jgi:diguanylate cyclase (GGDEF)-like protein/PAS domain S-box-containing protein